MIPEVAIVGTMREEQVSAEIVTWREFLQPTWNSPWLDPDGLLQMAATRREAFLAAPFEKRPDDPVRLVALKPGQVAGKTDFLPGILWIDGQPRRTFWSSGTVVAQNLRGQGLGVFLCVHKQALGEITATCGVSQMNIGIYHKLGGFRQFKLPRYVHLFNARPAVVRVAGDGALGRALMPLAQVALRCVSRILRTVAAPSLRGLRVRGLEAMPDAFDVLLKPARRVAPHRSAAWINWLL